MALTSGEGQGGGRPSNGRFSPGMEMIDVQVKENTTHYQTLCVPRNASRREIQASFRRLVKVYHPDKNPQRVKWAEGQMRKLLDAYETISDGTRRAIYDRYLLARRAGMSFVERMSRKKDDLAAQSKLVLHYLLDGEFEAAIDLHERLARHRVTFSLGHYLGECDYLDSLFLLGEAYEQRRMWRTAVRFYWEAYERERTEPRKRYFFDELRDRLRVIFSQRLVRGLAPEDALKNYRRALGMCSSGRDAALVHKKIAILQNRLGRPADAVESLNKAKQLCPNMKTIDAVRASIAGD